MQPFFVSRTRFEDRQYSYASIAQVLERIGVKRDEYRREGVFVLRSTVMNPWYGEAEQVGIDYLYQFVQHLHRVAHAAVVDGERAMLSAAEHSRIRPLTL